MFELADIVLDNCVPGGDSLLEFGGIKSGPGSTLAGIFIVNSILVETLKILNEKGLPLPILPVKMLMGITITTFMISTVQELNICNCKKNCSIIYLC